jgi:hypothetical protein
MQAEIHPLAPEHLPFFIPGVDGSDPLFSFMAIFTVVLVLLAGAFYFTLHALPEQMAHQSGHTQMQVVGILAILAMFTHNNAFWIVALLLAAFKMPDFLTPIKSIASSLETMRTPNSDAPATAHVVETPEEEH